MEETIVASPCDRHQEVTIDLTIPSSSKKSRGEFPRTRSEIRHRDRPSVVMQPIKRGFSLSDHVRKNNSPPPSSPPNLSNKFSRENSQSPFPSPLSGSSPAMSPKTFDQKLREKQRVKLSLQKLLFTAEEVQASNSK